MARTSLKRGLIALVVAPQLAATPLSILMFLGFRIGNIGVFGSMLPFAGQVLAALLATTMIVGGPTWMLLRAIHRETAGMYTAIGTAEGVALVVFIGYAGHGSLRADQAVAFAAVGLAGGLIALIFWFIAREFPSEVKQSPEARA